MTKRITAQQAGKAYEMIRKDVFQQREADKMKETIKLVKVLKCRKGYTIAQAALIAKRAYRLGVRSVFAN